MPVRLLVALLLAGCSASRSGSVPSPQACSPPTCPLAPEVFALEVTPPSDAAGIYADADLPTVSFDANGVVQLILEPLVRIQGVVYIGSASGSKLMNGTVLATRPSRIAGRPDRSYQALIDSSTGRYALAVSRSLPNEQYTLRIVGADPASIAPQTFQVIADGDTQFDPVIDDPQSLIRVFGTITDAVGAPIRGMQVQAIDPDSKTPVSTISTTDASGFTIRLSSTVRKLPSMTVQLVATPSPNITQPILTTPAISIVGQNMISYGMTVPAMAAPQSYRYPVIGVGSSGVEMPVVGASCRFTAMVPSSTSTNATVIADAQTDAEGAVTVQLVPSSASQMLSYQVAISPPASSDFASASKTITVGPMGGVGVTQRLMLRPKLQGRLLDTTGQPVPDVTIEPGPSLVSESSAPTSLADVHKIASTATDASGRFVVRVDPQSYDIALVPASGQFLPRRWLPRTQVPADTDLGDVLLSRGTVARVVVTDPGGGPLLNAAVQVYQIDAGNAACMGALSCLAPPRLEAEGTTDGTGALPVLLPAAN